MRQGLGRFMYALESGLEDPVWTIHNKRADSLLGHLERDKSWRQWVFWPSPSCVFSADCLAEITAFLGRLNEERKEDGRD